MDEEQNLIRDALNDNEIEAGLLTDLIYFVHCNDEGETEADWLGKGSYMRDRTKTKGLEEAQIHVGRCESCRNRLARITKRLQARSTMVSRG